jgi:hypothetical protein
MVGHACNPGTGELEEENCEFEASLGYITDPISSPTLPPKKDYKMLIAVESGRWIYWSSFLHN